MLSDDWSRTPEGQAYLSSARHAAQHRLLAYPFAIGLGASQQQSLISHEGISRRCTAESQGGDHDLQCTGTCEDLKQLKLDWGMLSCMARPQP